MDQLIGPILVLLAIAVLGAAIVLPIVALVISLQTSKRISELEALLTRLEPKPGVQASPPPREPQPPPEPTTVVSANQIESIIGRRWVGWAAITLILFATAFFFKYAFENRWIGELGRVAMGIIAGIGMGLAGFRYHRRGWRVFSQTLTAGGIVLLYLSIYAAFGYYQLVGQKTAFLFLVILIAETAVLARTYNAPAIAIMSLVGGFLNPVLLRSDQDQYQSFFAYLVTLDVGALALLKRWRGLSSVAYFGTQILFWLWFDQNYEPHKRVAVLVFQTTVFVIFLVAHFGRNFIRHEPATNEDALLLVVSPFIFFFTTYSLLNDTHHAWMGLFAIGLALLYASGAQVLRTRSSTSRREVLLLRSIALTFVAIAIPIQLSANWITLGWGLYAGVLAAVGFIRRAPPVRGATLGLFSFTVFNAKLVDIAKLQQFYRIIVFFVLGVLLLLVAWAYHNRAQTKAPE
jgi:uncharacterized membrane protein